VTEFVPDDERAMLTGYLDWYREIAERKLDGLSLAEATRVSTPTGVTLLGTIAHLGWVERRWFGHYLCGDAPDDADATTSFTVAADDTVEAIVARYRRACERSREVTAALELDTMTIIPHDVFGDQSLRWVLVHMIEETARHAGHLDILRELTDGRTGT
jgi:uncharacterized damage-inducible protein DinB